MECRCRKYSADINARKKDNEQTLYNMSYFQCIGRSHCRQLYGDARKSGSGETLSLVMEKKPGLHTAVLHIASVWDGALQPLAESRTPVYFVIGESDEYYGSSRISATYRQLCELYKVQSLREKQINVLDGKTAEYFEGDNQHQGAGKVAFDENIMG